MVKFMRKNARIIGWAIVLAFAGTMFSGTFLLRNMFKPQPGQANKNRRDLSNEIAVIGEAPVSKRHFSNSLQNMLGQLQSSSNRKRPINPEFLEYLVLNSFQQAVEHTIYYQGALDQKFKVSKAEYNAELQNIYRQYELKNKKEFKALLKKNQYPFKLFLARLKEDILSKKFVNSLVHDVRATDQDVENSFSKVKAQHILIPINWPTKDSKEATKLAEETSLNKVKSIREEIFAGLKFGNAAKKYSEDPGSKSNNGELGWFGPEQMVPQFSQAAFALDVGEISEPVKSMYGFHLIKVVDKKVSRPKDFDFEKTRQKLLNDRKQRRLNQYSQAKLATLKVNDPRILAIQVKQRGQYDKALQHYQQLSSSEPGNPAYHFLMARAYLLKADPSQKLALDEFEKAVLKTELNPSLDFAELHIEMAKLYRDLKQRKNMYSSLDQAYSIADEDLYVLNNLLTLYQDLKNKKRERKIQREIDRLEALKEEQAKLKSESAATENVTASK